jgi:transcription initiation factor TFIIIB Brf1 subunit/transcription initiation factor TFIIB
MSGHSYSQTCPECGSEDSLNISTDTKPYSNSGGVCIECGFGFWTTEGQWSLKDINEERAVQGLKPLKKLKEKCEK